MIVVKVELHHAVTGEVSELGEIKIWNVRAYRVKDTSLGDYEFLGHVSPSPYGDARGERTIVGHVDAHNRELNVWHLVRRALEKLP